MIKLFISDLDGTLLNKWHTSDREINQGIRQIKQKGYSFAVATGRHLRHHHRFGLKFLKDADYTIVMNGALVKNHKGEVIASSAIAPQAIEMLIKQFPEVSFEFLTAESVLVQASRWHHFYYGFKGQVTVTNVVRAILNMVGGRFSYQVASNEVQQASILKVECITNDLASQKRLIQFLDENKQWFSYAYNDEVHFEITGAGVNKQVGVLGVLKHLALHPDQVAVYGNDRNDIEMLSYFQHSYAPKGSRDVALEAAKHHIEPAPEHSVIRHILQTVKQQELK